MISKKTFITWSLLTALIMTLMFANLNVTPMGAAGAGAGNPGTTTTFNSNITMDFGSDKSTFLSNGTVMQFRNMTGDATTKIETGSWYTAWIVSYFSAPKEGGWYYVYGPGRLLSRYIAFKVDTVTGMGSYPNFNVSQVYNHYYHNPQNVTITPPVEAGTYLETELMTDLLGVCVDYSVLAGVDVPEIDSWWQIDYPSPDWFGSRFHVDDVYEFPTGFPYAHIDILQKWNVTAEQYDNVTSIPADPIPNDGFAAFELLTTVEPGINYSIFSPTPLLPEPGSWWDITYPTEKAGWQFNVSSSSEGNHFVIDTLLNTTGQPQNIILTEPEESISAVLATAPTVDTIGACEWFNVINGTTPAPQTWWNITTSSPVNDSLVDVQFYVDASGEGVFHIDETSGDVTVSPAVDNVTAEELTPAIYVYPDEIIDENLTPGDTFNVSIKTDYTLHVWGYEFTLEWNPAVLNVTAVTNASTFLTGATFMSGTADNVNGELSLTGAHFDYTDPPAPQVYGPGTLANVTFKVAGTGDSDINLGPETRLIKITEDGYGTEQNVIDDATGLIEHGYFRNTVAAVRHDVVLTKVNTSVSEEYQSALAPLVQINVTALNNGTLPETFDVKVYYDFIAANWLIGTQTVSNLANGTTDTWTFSWNITDVSYGNHTIKVKATLAFGVDANPADNTFVDGMVNVKIPGDINGDGEVEALDFFAFAAVYGTDVNDPLFDPRSDFNYSDEINFDDFIIFALKYGQHV